VEPLEAPYNVNNTDTVHTLTLAHTRLDSPNN